MRFRIVAMGLAVLSSMALGQVNFGLGPIKWSNFQTGGDCLISKDTTTVFNSENQWQRFWEKMTGNHGVSAPGGIDWGKELLVAIVLGNRAPGSTVMITDVSRTNPATVQVTYTDQKPGIQNPGINSVNPFVVILMDRAAADIKFVKQLVLAPDSFGPDRPSKSDLPWSTYMSDTDCNLSNAGIFVFRDQASFSDYWKQLNGDSSPAPQDVDWGREMLISIQMGEQPSNGYDVMVDRVCLSPNGVLVKAFYKTPDPGQHVRNQSSSPYVIVRTTAVRGDVSVERRSRH